MRLRVVGVVAACKGVRHDEAAHMHIRQPILV